MQGKDMARKEIKKFNVFDVLAIGMNIVAKATILRGLGSNEG
jgi:hypothetical protein